MSSLLLRKILATFVTCYGKALNVQGPESEPYTPCKKIQYCSPDHKSTLLATLASYSKIILHAVTT